jgi:hypothetical protein
MGKSDNDFLDRALDSAEAVIDSEKKEVIEEPIEGAEDLEKESKEVESTEKESVVEKTAPVRGKDGKFSKAPTSEEEDLDQSANVESQEVAAQATPEAPPPIGAPAFWSAEQKAIFAKAPRELQEVIAQRELTLQQHISRTANEAEKGKALEKRFYADFESPEEIQKHKAQLAVQGLSDPIAELHRYRAWDRILTSDVKTGIADLMRKNGLTPYDFTDEAMANGQESYDPRIDTALEKAEAAERQLKEWQEKQEQQVIAQKIEAFKNGVDSTGQSRRQFVELYAPQISSVYDRVLREHPEATMEEALEVATDAVRNAVNELHAPKQVAPAKPVRTKEQIIADAKKAQDAATTMSGSPTTGTVPKKSKLKGNSFKERLESALDVAEEMHR